MHAVFILDKPMSKYFRVSFEGEKPPTYAGPT